MSANRFERLVRTAARRPSITLAVVLALALAGGALSLGLRYAFFSASYRAIRENVGGFFTRPFSEPNEPEIEFLAIAGSTTASAAIGGADVLSMALINDRLLTSLVVGPAIQKPEDLKGKSIGISRFGTSIDTAARIAIQHYGLEPIKDVSLVQVGAVSSAVAALRGGRIHAAILSYPTIIQARREGFREILDIASLGTPYAANGITLRRSFMQQRREIAANFLRAFLEAIARVKKPVD